MPSTPASKSAKPVKAARDGDLAAGGELLLLKRAADAGLGPGLWGRPAGKIESGETPAAAAQREMAEEIGSNHKV